jgi:hypothetical protein
MDSPGETAVLELLHGKIDGYGIYFAPHLSEKHADLLQHNPAQVIDKAGLFCQRYEFRRRYGFTVIIPETPKGFRGREPAGF